MKIKILTIREAVVLLPNRKNHRVYRKPDSKKIELVIWSHEAVVEFLTEEETVKFICTDLPFSHEQGITVFDIMTGTYLFINADTSSIANILARGIGNFNFNS